MEKKILFAASTAGHVRHFHAGYIRALKALGMEIHGAWAGEASVEGLEKVWAVPFEKRMTALSNFKASFMLRKIMAREGYDAVIVHTSLAAFFLRLGLLGMKNRPRCINMVHGYLFDDESSAAKRLLLLAAEKLTAPVTELVLCMNRWDFQLAKTEGLGKRVEFIPGIGVEYESSTAEDGAALRCSLDIAEDDFVLIYPAEFSARKNQSFLIELLPRLPENVVLVLPGSGEMLEACKARAEELGMAERVRFPGYVVGMAAWYAMADTAVSSSRSEGLPFNIMEAMHAGLPVVASRVKGHCELVEQGQSGFLFPFGDGDACAEAIKNLEQDRELCEKMGQRGREKSLDFSREAVMPAVMEKNICL